MQPQEFVSQVTGVAALAEPVRRRLYLYVAGQAEPVTRDEASAALELPRHTVKFNLDRLVEEGLLDVEFRRLSGRKGPGAGRPSKLYRRSARETSVTLPERQYDVAAELMAEAIETSSRDGGPVVDALQRAARDRGASLGERVRARVGPDAEPAAVRAAALDEMAAGGYEPRTQDNAVTLANCPFHRLATEHTDLVCGMNLALLTSLLEALGDPSLQARLEPGEGRCCVVLSA